MQEVYAVVNEYAARGDENDAFEVVKIWATAELAQAHLEEYVSAIRGHWDTARIVYYADDTILNYDSYYVTAYLVHDA